MLIVVDMTYYLERARGPWVSLAAWGHTVFTSFWGSLSKHQNNEMRGLATLPTRLSDHHPIFKRQFQSISSLLNEISLLALVSLRIAPNSWQYSPQEATGTASTLYEYFIHQRIPISTYFLETQSRIFPSSHPQPHLFLCGPTMWFPLHSQQEHHLWVVSSIDWKCWSQWNHSTNYSPHSLEPLSSSSPQLNTWSSDHPKAMVEDSRSWESPVIADHFR